LGPSNDCCTSRRRRFPDEKGIETDGSNDEQKADSFKGGSASPMRRGLKPVGPLGFLLTLVGRRRFPDEKGIETVFALRLRQSKLLGGAASPMRRGLKLQQRPQYEPPYPGRRRFPDEKGIETSQMAF